MVHVPVLRRNLVVTACLLGLAGTAHAGDDRIVSRITDHSSLSTSSTKKLVNKVNVRMAKAADATAGASDPMRAAVSLALFQAPQPPDSMAAAKVRLRLYAGLNEWSLEAIFSPQPGVIAGCVREVGASQSECEALVAAAAKSSVAQIRNIAGGTAAPAAAPAYANQAPAAPGGGANARFGRFNSGYQQQQQQQAPRYAPPQQQYQAAPRYPAYPQQQQQQQRFGSGYQQQAPRYAPPQQQYQAAPRYPQQQQQYGGGGYQQPGYGRPAAPAAPAAPAYVPPQQAAARKDAYRAQREAYIARQKAQFEQRKQKVSAVHAADASEAPPREEERVDALTPVNAAAGKPAAPAATASAKPAKGAAPAADSGDEPPSEPVASKSDAKPALDNDFLDGLLDDPLAKGKK